MPRSRPLATALFALLMAFAMQPGTARAATLLVPQDVPTIQGAIDLAVDGDTVLVARGVYEENLVFLGKAITVKSADGAETTRIHSKSGLTVVDFISGEGNSSILKGFTLSRTEFSHDAGAVRIVSASPIIEDNIISENFACTGSAIYVENGAPVIRGNTIRTNWSSSGCEFYGPSSAGVMIVHTAAAAPGFSSPQVVGNIIADNIGAFQNTGLRIIGPSTPLVANNVIARNQSLGEAIVHVRSAQVTMINNTITDIELATGVDVDWSMGLALDSVAPGSVFLNNNIFIHGKLPAVLCSAVDLAAVVWQSNNVYSAGGAGYDVGCADQTGVNGNLSTDPEFVRFARGDYRLRPLSALVDAGTLGHPDVPAVDFDGLTRVFDGNGDGIAQIDIGAFETQGDPIADAGPNLLPSSSEIVVLDGGNSFDPEGGALTYLWHLDGLEVGTEASIALGPLDFGTHRARLTVTDEAGNSNADEVALTTLPPNNELPLVDVPPSALFYEGQTTTITFGPTPVDPDGTVVSYLWTLNDVAVGSEQTVTLGPLDKRDHIIEFTVTDNSGGSVTATILGIVLPDQPDPNAGPNQSVRVGETVLLDGSLSSDSGEALTYSWTLDGVEFATTEIATVNGLDIGTYNFVLTVTDPGGWAASDSAAVTVLPPNQPPVADAGPDQTVTKRETIILDGSGSFDPDRSTLTYVWSLDGSQIATGATPSVGPFPVGSYTVALTVTDADGATASDNVLLTVTNSAPVAEAGGDATIPTLWTMTLNGSRSFDPDGDALTYVWSINGVQIATGPTPRVGPFDAGVYTIVLTVTDSDGASATDSLILTVYNRAPLASAGPDLTIQTLETVALDGSGSSDPEGGPLTYAWSLDGTEIATGPTPTVGPFPAGNYNIILTVTDPEGASASDSMVLTIQNRAPLANAGADLAVPILDTILLNGSGSSDPEGDALTYAWSIGGVQIATGPAPTVGPFAEGVYTIILTVTDPFGASASDTMALTVFDPAPVADAGPDQTLTPIKGKTAIVTLDGSASRDPDSSLVSYLWTRDGKSVGSGVTLQLELKPGSYTFTLTVTAADGATASDTTLVTVTKPGSGT